MIDSFVLLTPFLLLGVIALVGFVGCNQVFGLEETEPIPPPDPPTLQATPGDRQVQLKWDLNPDATEYHVLRAEVSGNAKADYPVQRIVALNEIPYTDNIDVTNGKQYFYRVTSVTSGGESDVSNEASATPQSPYGAFVTGVSGGSVRNASPDGAFYGMAIKIQGIQLVARELGRSFTLGITVPHPVYLVRAATLDIYGPVTVDMNSDTDGDFKYGVLNPPVDLIPNETYYVLSQEFSSVDPFLEQNALVSHRMEALVTSAVYVESPPSYVTVGSTNNSYGPVNLKY